MITAIILARANSSRLKNKHLLKIGKYTLLENIYLKLKLNKNISEIYLATGEKKKNFIYCNFIKSKKLRIKIFYYKKENYVTERIYKLTKYIKNKYSLLISGDCPAIDNNFINRAYKKIKSTESDFIRTNKKTLHEGITLFKTKAWKKVQINSRNLISQENPGNVLSVKKNLFDVAIIKVLKKDTGKKLRLSIDTISDLQFFRLVNYHSNNHLINYNDTIKYKKYNLVNKDVVQKKSLEPKKKNIFIITSANNKIGYGHLARSKILHRQISEVYTSNVFYIFYKTKINSILKDYIEHKKYFYYKNFKIKNLKKCVFIIDLPLNYFSKEIRYFKIKKSIIIDNYSKFNNHINIIPTIKKIVNKKFDNILSGKKYLILSKDLLYEKLKNKIKKIDYLFIFGSTNSPDEKILNDITKSKIKNYLIVLGPFVKKSRVKNLKNKNFKIVFNPKNYYELLCLSKKVICIYGLSAYEAISVGLKPSIYALSNETDERLADIEFLNYKKLSKSYDYKDLKNIPQNKKNLKIDFGANYILDLI